MLALAEPQERAIAHRDGPLLLVGEAGTGKTEVLARRFQSLVAEGIAPERILLLTATPATARRLRARVEQLLDRPLEELWIGTWEQLGERLLREHATAAGLDPFFGVLGRAERLALLLDRIEELPLRHQQIRGNPAGLLARLIEQIDALKAGAEPADPELVELAAAHDRILAAACSLDRNDVHLTLARLLDERPDVRTQLAHRFEQLMVDEYEDTTRPQQALLQLLQAENPNHLYVEDAAPAGRAADHRPEPRLPRPPRPPLEVRQRARPGPGRRPRGRAPDRPRRRPRRDLRPGRGAGARGRGRRGDGGARRPLPHVGAGGALPAARGARRDRLAAGAGRPGRLGRRGAGADPTAGRAALGRPGAADDDRPAAQARPRLGLRGGAREPADPARGARADPVLPEALRRPPRRRWRNGAPTSSCAA